MMKINHHTSVLSIVLLAFQAWPCVSLTVPPLKNVKAGNHISTITSNSAISTAASATTITKEQYPDRVTSSKSTHLVFPGGGIFFYWQAGVISYLREKKYDLITDANNNKIQFTGASAGALCATLTTLNVDFAQATELALSKAEDAGVWDRPLGLQGVWGALIEEWLNELIPDDKSIEMAKDRLSLLVTEIPTFSKSRITQFNSKKDLIRCNMASVHIPFFLDGKLTTDYRSKAHIDGSFLSKPEDYHQNKSNNIITLDWTEDPILNDRTLADAVTALSKDGIWDLVERGRTYASFMEERGDFESLMIDSK